MIELVAWVASGVLLGVLSIIGGGNVVRGAAMAALVVAAVVWACTQRRQPKAMGAVQAALKLTRVT